MTQLQWQLLASKVTVLAAIISLAGWVAVYSNLAPWWRDHIGRTFVFKTLILILLLLLSVPGMFWTLSHLEADTLSWVEIALVGAITPVMLWRISVFIREGGGVTFRNRDRD